MSNSIEEFTSYDTADYLTSVDEAAAYLEAAVEEAGDDPAFIAQALGRRLNRRPDEPGGRARWRWTC